jgi:sarcosine oxidase
MTFLYDVAVVGLGAAGSAAAYELARRGVRVLGVDRWAPPHAHGSTHGRTRIIREAYYEHPLYVPLVRRAYELWGRLEEEAGETLFRQAGGLMVGPADGPLVAGARRSAEEHDIPHELLDAAQVRARFPAYAPPADAVALLEPRAGLLFPEACVAAFLARARQLGATLELGAAVESWTAGDGGVTLTTARGTFRAARAIFAAGPWLPELVPALAPALEVERQLFHWFDPADGERARHAPERMPIALWEYAPERIFATFPDVGDGVKCGVHHEGETTTADAVRRTIDEEETRQARALLAALMPGAAGALRDRATCLYTNTPDHHFLIDRLPGAERVIVASPCSGHGFKFASAVGELLAQMAVGEAPRFDVAPFGLARAAMEERLRDEARGERHEVGRGTTDTPPEHAPGSRH